MDENSKKLRNKRDYIVRLLKRAGKYAPEYSAQVNMCAGLLLTLEKMERVIFAPDFDPVYHQDSREGLPRRKQSPEVQLYLRVAAQLQSALKSLGMNLDGKGAPQGEDTLAGFLSEVGGD